MRRRFRVETLLQIFEVNITRGIKSIGQMAKPVEPWLQTGNAAGGYNRGAAI